VDEKQRVGFIREQVAIIWRSFGRRLDLTDEKDSAVADDYVKALERVPNKRLEYVIQCAKDLEKLPRARDMVKIWNPPEATSSPDRKEIFRPGFSEWLSDVGAMADYLFAQSKQADKGYRLIAEICDHAHFPSAGAVNRLKALPSTDACIELMVGWFRQAGIDDVNINYTLSQVQYQRDHAAELKREMQEKFSIGLKKIGDVPQNGQRNRADIKSGQQRP